MIYCENINLSKTYNIRFSLTDLTVHINIDRLSILINFGSNILMTKEFRIQKNDITFQVQEYMDVQRKIKPIKTFDV